MLVVVEYKNVLDLNEYLSRCKKKVDIVPLSRTFVNPHTDLLTSTITYIVIEDGE